MRRNKKQWLAGTLAVFLTAFLLGGCGGGSSDSSTTVEPAEESEAQQTTAAPEEAQAAAPAEGTESDLASLVRGNTDPSPELIERVNSTFDDSYLGDLFSSVGSDYSAYEEKKFDGVTLDVWYPDPNGITTVYPDLSEHPVFKQFTELTGINLNFIVPLGGEGKTEFNLMVTGQELPDIMINVNDYYNGGVTVAKEDGLILDLSEYEDKLPNYMYCLEHFADDGKAKRDSLTDEGERLVIYTLMLDEPAVSIGPLIKTKAMEDTGWTEVPETIEEWHSFLSDCKNAGYDVPLVIGNQEGFPRNGSSCFATAFGVTSSRFLKEDGTIAFGPAEEGLKDYLGTMRQWYEEGLIDPDYASGDSAHRQALITSDSCAAFISSPDGAAIMIGGSYGEDFVAAPFPVLNKGDRPAVDFYPSRLNSSAVASITSQCENIDAALAFLDFFYSKKGSELACTGTYGDIHLIDENGEPYTHEDSLGLTDVEIRDYGGSYTYKYHLQGWSRVLPSYIHSSDETAEKNVLGVIEGRSVWTADSKFLGIPGISMTPEENASLVDITNNIATAKDEYLTKIIVGQLPLSEVDTFRQTIQDMGLDMYLSVYQTAYERYLAR